MPLEKSLCIFYLGTWINSVKSDFRRTLSSDISHPYCSGHLAHLGAAVTI